MSHPYLLVWILNTPIWIFHYWIISQEIHTDKKHDFNSVANDLCLVRENFFLLCVLWGIYLHTYGQGVQHDPVSMIEGSEVELVISKQSTKVILFPTEQ